MLLSIVDVRMQAAWPRRGETLGYLTEFGGQDFSPLRAAPQEGQCPGSAREDEDRFGIVGSGLNGAMGGEEEVGYGAYLPSGLPEECSRKRVSSFHSRRGQVGDVLSG